MNANIGTSGSSISARNANAPRNFPPAISTPRTGDVISSSMVPFLRSSVTSPIVSRGTRQHEQEGLVLEELGEHDRRDVQLELGTAELLESAHRPAPPA